MARNSTRLKLAWIGKENRPQLEPRILVEDPPSSRDSGKAGPGKSHHAAHRLNEIVITQMRTLLAEPNMRRLKA